MGPALSEEARLMEIFNDSFNLAAKQIREETVSSQVLNTFLKYGFDYQKNQLELEKLNAEARLAEAKVEAIKESKTQSALFAGVIKAMSRYRGQEVPSDTEISMMINNEIIF